MSEPDDLNEKIKAICELGAPPEYILCGDCGLEFTGDGAMEKFYSHFADKHFMVEGKIE